MHYKLFAAAPAARKSPSTLADTLPMISYEFEGIGAGLG